MTTAVDNDVLLKVSSYALLESLLLPLAPMGVLGAARFIVEKKLKKRTANPAARIALLKLFLSQVGNLEPTRDEQVYAADLELAAQRTGVALDTGESQLCAIVVRRKLPRLISGDKRAIFALEKLLDQDPSLTYLQKRLLCLEQLFLAAFSRCGSALLRAAVCSEPGADIALSICFSCGNDSVPEGSYSQGLESYVGAIRRDAPRILSD